MEQAHLLEGEFATALRFALGSDRETMNKSPHLWLAAALSRSAVAIPDEIAKRFANLGPIAQATTGYAWGKVTRQHRNQNVHSMMNDPFDTIEAVRLPRVEQTSPVEHVWAATYHRKPDPEAPLFYMAAEIQWAALAWPSHMMPYFAYAVSEIGEDLIDGKVDSYSAFFEPLFDPDVPLDEMAALLMLFGLTAANKAVQGVAVDALVATIDDGRVDLRLFTEVLRRLLETGVVKINRLCGNLKRVAEVSSLHRHVVATLVQDAVAGAAEAVLAKDLHHILELVHENLVGVGRGVTNPGFHALLQSQTSGKAGKLAKAISALPYALNMKTFVEIITPLVQSRIARAQRWAACGGEG